MSAAEPTRTGDLWGGLSAMLVALPSAIAFGVTIYASLGTSFAPRGAVAGILGTIVLGIVAASLGSTRFLITAPSAPAVAVLSAMAIEMHGRPVLLILILAALGCGVFQILLGVAGIGALIKYMPYPVTSGYLTGVGLLILAGQTPKWLGTNTPFSLATWNWKGIAVGAVTMTVMTLAHRATRAVPAPVLGLAAGMATHFALHGGAAVIGPIGASASTVLPTIAGEWAGIGRLTTAQFGTAAYGAMTLAVLLSIDTLKTCVSLDSLTRQHHDSNRELIAQGCGNLAAAAIGGIPGSGATGPTMVNLNSGAATRWSGVFAGVMALLIFLVGGRAIEVMPVAALAGILLVVGWRMCDWTSLHLLRSRDTLLDFSVIVAVVVAALWANLVAASAVGVGLAILMFLREQIGGSVVRNKATGRQIFSRQVRLPQEIEILEKAGERWVVFELQGSLFFGTAGRLYTEIEPELKTRDYVVLDMRRVQSVDFTAAHALAQIGDILAERKAELILTHFPRKAPSSKDLRQYLQHVGLERPERPVRVFSHLDDALDYIEAAVLTAAHVEREPERPLELREIAVFQKRKQETLAALEQAMEKRSYRAGEFVFHSHDTGDELFLIRRGSVRVLMPLSDGAEHHLATFGRGDFIGEMAFLWNKERSADAVAETDTDLYILSRKRFDALAEEHKRLAIDLLDGLAQALAQRLRRANTELRAVHEE